MQIKRPKISISDFVRSKVKEVNWAFGKESVLKQLYAMTKIHVPHYYHGNWNYKSKRMSFDRHSFMKNKIGNICKICQEKESLDRHHIIPIANGGVSIKENIIGICRKCHSEIHHFEVGC